MNYRRVNYRRVLPLVLIVLLGSGFAVAEPNPKPAAAYPPILTAFSTAYPDSATSGSSCQVCHLNGGGDEPWNAYGWSVRQRIVDEGMSHAEAIAAVAMLDADENGVSNLDEITAGAAPGWTEGAANTIYFASGATMEDQTPPALSIELDVSVTMTEPMTTTPGTTPLPAITSTVPYDEATDGDLSNNRPAPNQFTLMAGHSVITATSVQGDLEYFTIIIPEGMVLDSILLNSYESASTQSFIGVQTGFTFTEPPTGTVPANLLGYTLFGADPTVAGTNILDDMGAAGDAMGFSGPLPAGVYAFWSQETSANESTYSLTFVVKSAFRVYLPIVYSQ